jgi:hypothetical protein
VSGRQTALALKLGSPLREVGDCHLDGFSASSPPKLNTQKITAKKTEY